MPRRAPLRLHIRSALRAPPTVPTSAALACALVKHVLFMQQQLPCLYDELLREVAPLLAAVHEPPPHAPAPDHDVVAPPPAKRRRRSPLQRKALKLVAAAECLFSTMPAVISACDAAAPAAPTVLALVLGASPASPKLVVFVRIARAPPSAGAADAEQAVDHNACRRVLRDATMGCTSLAAVSLGHSLRLHLMLQAPRSAALAPHFKPRPALRLRLRNAHVCTLSVDGPPAAQFAEPADGAAPEWCTAPTDGWDPAAPVRRPAAARGVEGYVDGAPAPFAPSFAPPHSPGLLAAGLGDDLPPASAEPSADEGPIWFVAAATIKGFRV